MIISASRRTDIPHYYNAWFFRRLEEGFVQVQNPVSPHQISQVRLNRELVDGIVFWTKNPAPMFDQLDKLEGYTYYFQFTLTGYGRTVERHLPDVKKRVEIFQRLSELVGKKAVIWRYDPILFTGDFYTEKWHLETFQRIGERLAGYTEKCVISFADIYRKNQRNMRRLGMEMKSQEEIFCFAESLAEEARKLGIELRACGEALDLSMVGIEKNACIDPKLLESLGGYKLTVPRDKNQRSKCFCAQSIDIGAYDTCRTGCLYCYANESDEAVRNHTELYDWKSPVLCHKKDQKDRILERKVKAFKELQYTLFED